MQGQAVGGHGPLGVGRVVGGGGRLGRLAVAPQVGADHRVRPGQQRRHPVPGRVGPRMPVQQQHGGPDPPWRTRSTASPDVDPLQCEPVEHRALLRPVLDGSRYHEQYDHGSAEAQLSEPGAARPSRRPPGRAPQGTGRPAAAAGRGPARPPRPGNRQPAGRRARGPAPPALQPPAALRRRAWCGSSAAAARPSTSSATPGSSSLLPLLNRSPATCGLRPGPRWPPPGPATTTSPGRWESGCTAPWSAAGPWRSGPTGRSARRDGLPDTGRPRVDVAGPSPQGAGAGLPLPAPPSAPPTWPAPSARRRRRPAHRGWVERTPGSRTVQLTPAGPAACAGARPDPRARRV